MIGQTISHYRADCCEGVPLPSFHVGSIALSQLGGVVNWNVELKEKGKKEKYYGQPGTAEKISE